MFDTCHWLNEPRMWKREGDDLVAIADQGSDFWRHTHYGFLRDSGHCIGRVMVEDFTVSVRVDGTIDHLYDQAGLFVRVDEEQWIKAGVEFNDGSPMVASVLTVGKSDWAIGQVAKFNEPYWMRITLSNDVIRVQFSQDGNTWSLVRLSAFNARKSCFVGAFCCSPERAGLEIRFSSFEISAPIVTGLHDQS